MEAFVGLSLSLVGFVAGALLLFILYWIRTHCPLCFKSWAKKSTIRVGSKSDRIQEWQCECCGHAEWLQVGRRFSLPTSF